MWHLRNQPLGISLSRLSEGRGGREILMRSEEAQIGKRVRLRTDYCKTNLRAQEGTIAKRWESCLQVKGWLTGRRSLA
jgi:hypothetical protein